MVSLANVHPCYFTIRPEEVTVDLGITLEAITICLSEDKQQRTSEGIALQLEKLVIDSTHTLMTRFVDFSLESFSILHLSSTDYLSSLEALNEGHAILMSPSTGPVLTVKSTRYQEQSVLAGKVVAHVNIALLNVVVDRYLKAGMNLIGSLLEPVEGTMERIHQHKKTKSKQGKKGEKQRKNVDGAASKPTRSDSITTTTSQPPSSSTAVAAMSSSSSSSSSHPSDVEVRMDCAGLDLLLRGDDDQHSLRLHLAGMEYIFNTREHKQHEFGLECLSLALEEELLVQCGGIYDQHGIVVAVTREKGIEVEIADLQCSLELDAHLSNLVSLLESVSD